MLSYKMIENDPRYLEAVRNLAKGYGISFKEMLQSERERFAKNIGLGVHYASLKAAEQKIRDECVYFCYQDVGEDALQHTNGEMIHGYYRIVKTDSCYEFTLMETDMQHESWQKRIKDKHVTRFPLEVLMGTGSFKDVTPDKIH
jgi:hypothetical protein